MMRYVWTLIVLIFVSSAELPDLGSPAHTPLSQQTRRALAGEIMHELHAQKVISEDPIMNEMLRRISSRLLSATGFRARFHVAAIAEPNAFALPDGQIVVHTGLVQMARREDELAAVMAHEISHVAKHHIDQMVGLSKKLILQQIIGLALGVAIGMHEQDVGTSVMMASNALSHQQMLSFSRDREFEADEVAHDIILAADYDPHAMADMFGHFEDMRKYHGSVPTYLLTHPQDEDRIKVAKEWAQKFPKREQKTGIFDYERAYLLAENSSLKEASRPFDNPEQTWQHYGGARVQMRRGNYSTALSVLEKLESNYLIDLAKAECMLHLGRDEDAANTVWGEIAQYKNNGAYTLIASNILYEAKKYDKAAVAAELAPKSKARAKQLLQAYRKLGKDVPAIIAQADYWLLSHQRERAIVLLRDSIKKYPDGIDNQRLAAKLDEAELAAVH